ncbi:SCO family protein [Pseudooceanicola nanhaiensis]|jgi:protein SCO1/2|uniref:Electron transporter SenC n=1 Tax=Pseudooceanicola nanhaiensis TaxID=375761 RepID=A0A917W8H5_9RHOB|nr:SCO family protein [Pseudooceanicola nanhaiensis]GGL82467.1 electron transporter SenC [Pseudooceanicola nanhaiensis]
MRLSGKHIAIGVLWGVALVALGWFAWARLIAPTFEQSIADTIGPGDYRLETTSGGTFTEASLEGGPSAVFFGFTHCPEVCPTTLGDIATWQEELGPDEKLRVYFVTVDPERDDIDTLRDYVSWAPGVEGVSGTPEEVEKALRAFRIYARKVPLGDGDYTMDHSANVLLFDEDGVFFEPVGYQEDYDRVMDKIRRMQAG